MEENLLDMMNADASTPKEGQTKEDGYKRISELAHKQKLLQKEIEFAEEKLKLLNEKHREISEKLIPDLFDQLGVSMIKLDSGEKVEVESGFAANITAANQEKCFQYLKDTGNESIIKHDVAVAIKKGEKEDYDKLLKFLTEIGATYTDKSYVHFMTLKSFVKEQIAKGKDFPMELFQVFPVRKTKIK